jgi:MFS family permease
LLGPSLAGLIIAGFGEGYCFLLDGLSYFAVIASLLLMRVEASQIKRAASSVLEQLREGWTYVRDFAPVRTILLLFALVSLMGMPYTVLMPIFATQVLHGGPHTLGFLLGATGVGALVSAVSLAARKSVLGLGRMIPISAAIFGIGLFLLGLSHVLWISLAMMLLTGFGMMQGMASSNTIIQTVVPEDRRGRVMSYYTMAFVGMAPFGSLLAGGLAHWLGAPRTVMITGSFVLAGGIWFWSKLNAIRAAIRPIYEEMGILPPRQPVDVEDAANTSATL